MKKVSSSPSNGDSRYPAIPYKIWRFGRSLAFVSGCACLLAVTPDSSRSSPLLLFAALVMALRWQVSHRYLMVDMTVRESAMGGVVLGVTALSLLWQSFRSLCLHQQQPNSNCVGIYVFLGWASSYFTGEALAVLVLSFRRRSTIECNTGDDNDSINYSRGGLILKGTEGVEENLDEEVGQDTSNNEPDIGILDEGSLTPSTMYETGRPNWEDDYDANDVSREVTLQQENNEGTVIDTPENGFNVNRLSGRFSPGCLPPGVEGEHGHSKETSFLDVTTSGTYQVQSLPVTDPYGEQGTYTGSISNATNMPHGYGRLDYYSAGRWYEGKNSTTLCEICLVILPLRVSEIVLYRRLEAWPLDW